MPFYKRKTFYARLVVIAIGALVTFDVVGINNPIIQYMGAILSGLGVQFPYKSSNKKKEDDSDMDKKDLIKPLVFLIGISLLFVSFTGCTSTEHFRQYVKADKATFSIVAPKFDEYTDEDPDLTEEENERYDRLLQSWRKRIKNTEEMLEEVE